MNEIEILLAVLKGLLPDEVVARSVTAAPVLAALVWVAWRIFAWAVGDEAVIKPYRKLLPLLVIVVGQGFGAYAAGGFDAVGAAAGLLTGALAIGGHSGLKNLLQLPAALGIRSQQKT